MTCSLYNYTRGTWKKLISEWSEDEQRRIPKFIEHVKTGQISGNKDIVNKFVWKCECGHHLCQSLLSRLLEKHQNPGSRKLIWKVDGKNLRLEGPEDYYWEFANMFMLYGTEKTREMCTMPEDTDLTLIIKMMKNCKLFELSDIALYDEVLGVRNSLMHSSHRKISFNKLLEYGDVMRRFLDAIKGKEDVDPEYKLEIESALRELDVLLRKNVRIELTIGELDMIIKALEFQQKAIQRDLKFRSVTSRAPEELNEHLLSSQRQIKQYTIIINEYRPALSIADATARKEAIKAIDKGFKDKDRVRNLKKEILRFDVVKRRKQEEETRIIEERKRRIRGLERQRREEEERKRREDGEQKRNMKYTGKSVNQKAFENRFKDEDRVRKLKGVTLRFDLGKQKKQEEETRIKEETERRTRELERKRREEEKRKRREDEEQKRNKKDEDKSENQKAFENRVKDEDRVRKLKDVTLSFDLGKKKKQEKETRIKEETERRTRELERKRREEEERKRREDEEQKRNKKDEDKSENQVDVDVGSPARAAAGAATGMVAGAVLGPVGVVVGGAVGAFFGAMS